MMTVEQSGERSAQMWQALGEQIAAAVPDLVISGDVDAAVKWAAYADACFYQATGEASLNAINEILASKTAPHA